MPQSAKVSDNGRGFRGDFPEADAVSLGARTAVRVTLSLVAGLACAIPSVALAAVPVIPGASGFGITTPAGRGGTVYRVTNLNASGAGSLAECVAASGPRVCVFEVSGSIQLTSELRIRNPYITIAGQTAPSPGITLRGAGLTVDNTHDVLVQHLRIRVGDSATGPAPDNRDGLQILADDAPAYNIVFDHLSVSWAIDENIQFWWPGIRDVSVRNTISSEALYSSLHTDSPHSMGFIVDEVKNVTSQFNLLAHNDQRNVRVKPGGEIDWVNNVVYNYGIKGIHTEGLVNAVGNYYKKGPNSGSDTVYLASADAKVYTKDNIGLEAGNASGPVVTSALTASSILSAQAAYDFVLKNVGARPADRDAVDTRIINEVKSGSGRLINSPSDVGGWPSLAQNKRTLTLPSNPNAINSDGYTNLEKWLHGMAADVEGRTGTPAPNPPAQVIAE